MAVTWRPTVKRNTKWPGRCSTWVELLYQATLVKDTNLTVSTVHFDRAEDAIATLLAKVLEGLREIEASDRKEQK